MAVFEIFLISLGVWLIMVPFFRKTRCGWWVEVSFRLCLGLGLALLAPWTPWSLAIMVPVLSILGVCTATCHWVGSSLVTSLCCGSALGGMFWQAALCEYVDAWWHGWVMAFSTLIFTVIFTCTTVGPVLFLPLILPSMAAMLITAGVAGLQVSPMFDFQPEQLFASAPCAAEEGMVAAHFAGFWFCLTLVAMATWRLAAVLFRDKDADGQGSLVSSLLPDGDDSLMPRPGTTENRHLVITRAIYAPEGDDLSHLTENEKKLVEICRKDPEERDRVLFGGGLY